MRRTSLLSVAAGVVRLFGGSRSSPEAGAPDPAVAAALTDTTFLMPDFSRTFNNAAALVAR